MKKKLQIDPALLEDLSQCVSVLYEIVRSKHLDAIDIKRLNYVKKLMESSSNLLSKAKTV